MAENGMIEILRSIQADIAGLKADMTGLKHDMAGLKADNADAKAELRSHSDVLNILLQEVREVRAAVNDIERTRVSAGEIEALHHDVTRMQRGLSDLTVRMERMEGRR
jgi:chromosome segregation ATPase